MKEKGREGERERERKTDREREGMGGREREYVYWRNIYMYCYFISYLFYIPIN